MCNLVVDGIGYSFGAFLPELVKYFEVGKGTIALVGSILAGSLLAVGPVVSALCNKYGCRAVCMVGSVIATFGFLLSSFCTNVPFMMITYGAIGGIGFGMMYLPAVVAVGYYFDTKRSLATGIAVCGSGVGTFAFPPLASYLLNKYGSWQSANLILAGLILNGVVFGSLMRPLTYPKKKQSILLELQTVEKNLQMPRGSNDYINEKPVAKVENSPQNMSRNVSLPAFTSIGMSTIKSVPSFERNYSIDRPKLSLARPRAVSKGSISMDCEGQFYSSRMSVSSKEQPKMVRPLSRKDIFYTGSIVNLPQYQSQKSLQGFRNSMISLQHRQSDVERDGVAISGPSMFDVSLFKDKAFMLIGLSNFFGMAALYIPFVYISQAAIYKGVDPTQAAFLVSVIGITNTVARIVCGYIADFPWMDSLFLNNICLVMATVSVAFTPFCASYASFLCVLIVFGIAIAGYISLTSIILVDLLGLDKLTNAFGLLILFRGTACYIGSPLAGAIYDMTESYDASFYVAALFFLASAIASFAAPRFRKKQEEVHDPTVLSPITEDQEESEDEDALAMNHDKNRDIHAQKRSDDV
ncbi:monocarboxylate transporter 4-like [Hyposmocoma kahamanoa]|uniref:monocarboxylate transporter 4-like n=1 Tax=Hyposmocoma kahamanoa TaxID=1477025 RepID=UPI000E6D8321|nr:monocarboxylate transporter 4-like [Hyposmocoma kahamanoa]